MAGHEGFTEFVAAQGAALSRTAYFLAADHAGAEDLLQAALTRTAGRWHRASTEQNPTAYVRQLMLDRVRSVWRRRRQPPGQPAPAAPPDQGDVASEPAAWIGLRRLAPRQRAVLCLRFHEDRTAAETALLLGCSVGTVELEVVEALTRLRTDPAPVRAPAPVGVSGPGWLAEAYRAAGETVPDYCDAAAAMAGARRRRARAIVGAPVAVGLLVAAGTALGSGTDGAPGSDHGRRAALDGTSLVYRSCADSCRIGLVDDGAAAVDLASMAPQLASDLADRGLDGVTMSYDGTWVGVPDGTGFTLHDLYESITIDLPAGPVGTHWQAYEWNESSGLVLAQWSGGDVVRYALMRTNYATDAQEVDLVDAPDDPDLVPAFPPFYNLDDFHLVEAVDVTVPPAGRPPVTVMVPWSLSVTPRELGHPPWDAPRNLADCLRRGETLAGPNGAPVELRTATSALPGQLNAVVVFGVAGDALAPSAVVRGGCADTIGATPADTRRYDLPQTTADDAWTLLGPVPRAHENRAVLMGHLPSGSAGMDLVAVGSRGGRRTVGELPADAEVVMSGTTYGQLG